MTGTYGSPKVLTYAGTYDGPGNVTVGNYCSIANEVVFNAGGEHHTQWVTTSPLTCMYQGAPAPAEFARPIDIVVGSDVWIGYRVLILGGVTIGHGAVIGAGAVVRKDVPPFAIVGGVPARVIRYRFDPEQIAALLEIRWWDWPEDKVLRYKKLLFSPDVDGFIAAAREGRHG